MTQQERGVLLDLKLADWNQVAKLVLEVDMTERKTLQQNLQLQTPSSCNVLERT